VEQGNIVTAEMVEELKPDMTRRQVQFVLGTPIIEDTFNANRWDYIYLLRIGDEVTKESRLRVIFDGDRLVDVKGELVGDNWPEPKPEEDESEDASA
jgi:outer membrane protein assembly factor BamE